MNDESKVEVRVPTWCRDVRTEENLRRRNRASNTEKKIRVATQQAHCRALIIISKRFHGSSRKFVARRDSNVVEAELETRFFELSLKGFCCEKNEKYGARLCSKRE